MLYIIHSLQKEYQPPGDKWTFSLLPNASDEQNAAVSWDSKYASPTCNRTRELSFLLKKVSFFESRKANKQQEKKHERSKITLAVQ